MTRVVLTLIAGLAATVVAPFAQPTVPKIPICAGMTIVTAVNDATGDYESIKTLESVDAKQIVMRYSTQKMDYGDMLDSHPPKLQSYDFRRVILREDIRTSRAYLQEFSPLLPEAVPGMTAFGTAMEKTHTAEFLAHHIVTWMEPLGVTAILAGFFLFTILLTQPMSNAAAALVVLPVAMSTAAKLGVNQRTFAIAIMLAASISFIAPFEPSVSVCGRRSCSAKNSASSWRVPDPDSRCSQTRAPSSRG